ncbi:MAG: hypothetical protein ACI83P_002740, partial [Janthinobacterium sp.]
TADARFGNNVGHNNPINIVCAAAPMGGNADRADLCKAPYFKAIRRFSQIRLIYNTYKQIHFSLDGQMVLPVLRKRTTVVHR